MHELAIVTSYIDILCTRAIKRNMHFIHSEYNYIVKKEVTLIVRLDL